MDTLEKIALERFTDVSVAEFLQILQQLGAIAVQLPDGNAVIVQVQPELPALPILEGYIPTGWKDAIYEH